MKNGVGVPVSTDIRVPARTFNKAQTSTAHAVEEWTPCCHRLLVEFSEFAGSEYRRSVR